MSVALRHFSNWERPIDSEQGVKRVDAAGRRRVKFLRVQVQHFAIGTYRLKTVRKAFGDQQAALVVG